MTTRLAVLLPLLVPLAGQAAPAPAEAGGEQPVRIQRRAIEIELGPGGESVSVLEQRIKVQTRAGVEGAAQMALPYSASLQKLDVLEAYTQKPDGRRLEVGKEAIFVRDLPAATGAPALADQKVAVLVFPDVAVGDTLLLRVRQEQVKPLFAGHYSGLFVTSPHQLVDEASVTVRAPPGVTVHVENLGWEEVETKGAEGTVRRWTSRNTEVEPREDGAVAPLDYSARLVVSTFADDAAFARAYDGPAREKAVVTPAIRELANRLTTGVTDEREKVRRIYEWQIENVRYVGIFLGAGAVVPHPAGDVLANRYGDCKDQVALLQALLGSQGIDSTPALVNAGNGFWLPKVPAIGAFNHAIAYVPSLDLFLDPTSREAPFGVLPEEVQGRTAVLSRTGERRRVPLDSAADSTSRRLVRLEVQDDGTVVGVTEIEARGWRAAAYRQLARSLTAEQRPEFVRRQTTDDRYRGEGRLELLEVAEKALHAKVRVAYTLRGGLDWPGSGAFEVPTGFRGSGAMLTQPVRGNVAWKRPHVFGPCELAEEYAILLPAGMKVISLPSDVTFANEITSYRATYRLEGRRLLVSRTLRDRFVPPLILPSQARAVEAYSDAISRDLRAQIVYARE